MDTINDLIKIGIAANILITGIYVIMTIWALITCESYLNRTEVFKSCIFSPDDFGIIFYSLCHGLTVMAILLWSIFGIYKLIW